MLVMVRAMAPVTGMPPKNGTVMLAIPWPISSVLLLVREPDYVPLATLSAVLMVVAYNMSGWRTVRAIFHSPRSDTSVLVVTFLLTVIFDLTIAIEIGLLLAGLLAIAERIISSNLVATPKKNGPSISYTINAAKA